MPSGIAIFPREHVFQAYAQQSCIEFSSQFYVNDVIFNEISFTNVVEDGQFDTISLPYIFLASILNNSQVIHPVNFFRIG